MPIFLLVLGLGIFIWEVISFQFLRRRIKSGELPEPWRRRRKIAHIVGAVLVLTLPCQQYSISGGWALGIPFVSAWFDAQGRDYTGAITLPALAGNAIVWFLVPQLVLARIARKTLKPTGET